MIATRRGDDGLPAEIRTLVAVRRSSLETKRSRLGTLALRGAMVPAHVFPPGAEHGPAAKLIVADDGFIDTGFTCKLDDATQSLTVTGAARRHYRHWRLSFPAGRSRNAGRHAADPAAAVVALPGGVMAQQLAGRALDPNAVRAILRQNGVNPLIAEAFRPRGSANAA